MLERRKVKTMEMPKKAAFKRHKPRLSRFGSYLYGLRVQSRISLLQLAARLGVNHTYISHVERGLREPDDDFVLNLARLYELDENELFEMIGRVPLVVRQEVEQNLVLQTTLKEIINSPFSQQKKQELYQEFHQIYKWALA